MKSGNRLFGPVKIENNEGLQEISYKNIPIQELQFDDVPKSKDPSTFKSFLERGKYR